MKKAILLVIFSALINFVYAQNCEYETLRLNKQSDVDEFIEQNSHCSNIYGNLYLGATHVTNNFVSNIDGLVLIDSIFGDLVIRNTIIQDFSGFDSLKYVEGSIIIDQNTFKELKGFGGLTETNNIQLRTNSFAEVISAFNNVKKINGHLSSLGLRYTEFSAFSQLEEISKSLSFRVLLSDSLPELPKLRKIGEDITILSCPDLVKIGTGLVGIDSVTRLEIGHNPKLESFDGISVQSTLYLSIHNNNKILNLEGLSSIRNVHDELYIGFNESIQTLEGIEELDSAYIQKLQIRNNPNLTECGIEPICLIVKKKGLETNILSNAEGCNSFTEIARNSCNIYNCYPYDGVFDTQEKINTLNTVYASCKTIMGDVCIGNCGGENAASDIIDLGPTLNLDTILGNLVIQNNPQLISTGALEKMKDIQGNIHVENNSTLESIGLGPNIGLINGSYTVKNNPKLARIEHLRFKYAIKGDLTIENNQSLSFLPDLREVRFIDGNLNILDNENLSGSITSENLKIITGDIVVKNNPKLGSAVDNEHDHFVCWGDVVQDGNLRNGAIGLDSIYGSLVVRDAVLEYSVQKPKYVGRDYIVNGPNAIVYSLPRTIRGSVTIENSANKLLSMDSIFIGGDINIVNNQELRAIKVESPIEFNSEKTVSINSNPKLSLCLSNNLCELYNSPLVEFTAINNDTICTTDRITLACEQDICDNFPNYIRYQEEVDMFFNNEVSCKTLYDDLKISPMEDLDISALSELEYIIGDLYVRNNAAYEVDYSHLSNIKIVEGNVSIDNLDKDEIKFMSNLEFIRNRLEVSNSDIESFDFFNKLNHCTQIKLYNLSELSNLNRIKQISGSMLTDVTLSILPKLESLDVLSGLNQLKELTLDSLQNISNLDVLDDLYFLQDFTMRKLHKVKNMWGLNKITNIRDLLIRENNGLENLSGLENLRYIRSLSILYNDSLLNIDALQNVLANDVYSSSIKHNKQLYACQNKFVCAYVEEHPTLQSAYLNNSPACEDIYDIDCENSHIILRMYYDKNANGTKEPHEELVPNCHLKVNSEYVAISNSNGEINLSFLSTDDIELMLDDPIYTALATETMVLDESYNGETINWGVDIPEDHNESSLFIHYNNPRCSELSTITITHSPVNLAQESGVIELKYSAEQRFISTSWEDVEIDTINNKIKFNYTNGSQVFENRTIELLFEMPDFNFIGETMKLSLSDQYWQDNQLIDLSAYNHEEILRCSYDPNDKLVSPVGIGDENYYLKDQAVNYTIRFQNTGNDYAKNVRILDTLDVGLDIETFRFLGASHECYVSINGREVAFDLPEIYLPDSTANESASHGYIQFSIQFEEDLDDFTSVDNDASIYFDFNPPILTNTVSSNVVEEIPTTTHNLMYDKISISPNPTRGSITISNYTSNQVENVSIYNMNGTLISHQKDLTIDMKSYPNGVYLIQLIMDNGLTVIKKVVLAK